MTTNILTLGDKFDAVVTSLLNYSKVDWKNQELYMWEFTPEHLNHNTTFGNYKPSQLSATQVSENISGKLYLSQTIRSNINLFLVELKVESANSDSSPRNFVITNRRPTPTLFKDDEWHSKVGEWYNEFK